NSFATPTGVHPGARATTFIVGELARKDAPHTSLLPPPKSPPEVVFSKSWECVNPGEGGVSIASYGYRTGPPRYLAEVSQTENWHSPCPVCFRRSGRVFVRHQTQMRVAGRLRGEAGLPAVVQQIACDVPGRGQEHILKQIHQRGPRLLGLGGAVQLQQRLQTRAQFGEFGGCGEARHHRQSYASS